MQQQTRLATKDDIASILQITKSAFTKYSQMLGKPVAALNETAATITQDLQNKDIILGLYNEYPIGVVRLQYFKTDTGKIAYLSRFGVHQDAPKCNMGDTLLESALAHCRENGCTAVVLHTASKMLPVVSMYMKHGFYVHSTTTDRGYIRAAMVCEINVPKDKPLDLSPVLTF